MRFLYNDSKADCDYGKECDQKRNCRKQPVPVKGQDDLSHITAPFFRVGFGAASGDTPVAVRENLAQQYAECIDVRTAVNKCTWVHLFRGSVTFCIGRFLENRVIIRIGKPKINYFDIVLQVRQCPRI